MRISLNEIKKLVPKAAEVSPDELVKLIGSRLVEVEEKINWSEKYQGAYIVKVASCEAIPETHLHLCQIETKDGLVQVVCGAPNVRAGMFAVWLAPGAIVPQTFGEENFKLDVRKLRGFESHGMLAGLDELALGDDHSGIVEIDPHQKYPDGSREIQPGDSFAEVFDLNDIILDIENKSLTHRPDTFGLIGFAREVAGILGEKFDEENAKTVTRLGGATVEQQGAKVWEDDIAESSATKSISIEIKDQNLCPRYSCAVLEMKDALSDDRFLTPMDVFLAKAGMHGISKIVDITNYLMLMTGQPLHAFDYDKFVKTGGKDKPAIIVRAAKEGEELQLLDGKTIKCNENDILITSNDVPVALAGAMGGKNTEIDESTTRVILESATFSLYHLRKTQMAHGIFSEAITRFTKGQPAEQTASVLKTACEMLSGDVTEIADEYPEPVRPSVVDTSIRAINSLLGTNYDLPTVKNTLENVGLKVEVARDDSPAISIRVTAPLWRTDLHIEEDIIEEVGRLLGYDNIPIDYPVRPFIGAKEDAMLELKSKLRNILSDKLDSHELLTYSFVSKKLQSDVGEDPHDSYEIVNSISPELQCFRQSIIPSLLEKMRDNLKSGYRDFSVYEINQVTKKSYKLDDDKVPVLYTHLAFVTTGDYYTMKANLVALLSELGFRDLAFHQYDGHFPYFESVRSATIQTPHVCCGEVKSSILKRFKINQPIAAYEINLDGLIKELPEAVVKMPALSRFPSVERDITFKVNTDVAFAKIEDAIAKSFAAYGNGSPAVGELITNIAPVSIYKAEEGATTRNISFHLEFGSMKKTLENTEISDIMEEVEKNVKKEVGAEIV